MLSAQGPLPEGPALRTRLLSPPFLLPEPVRGLLLMQPPDLRVVQDLQHLCTQCNPLAATMLLGKQWAVWQSSTPQSGCIACTKFRRRCVMHWLPGSLYHIVVRGAQMVTVPGTQELHPA